MRRAGLAIVLAACGRSGFDSGAVDALTTAHSTLALDRLDPGEQLFDVPVLVVLDDSRLDRALLASDASNLRFYDGSGTPLVYEIEQLGSAGGPPLLAWLSLPQVTGLATTFTVAYGDPGAPSASGAVWSADYVAVYHLAESNVMTTVDAAGQHEGTSLGTEPMLGFIGTGRSFDITNPNAILLADSPAFALSTTFTLSGWMYLRTTPGPYAALLSREDGQGGNNDFFVGEATGAASGVCSNATGQSGVTGGAVPNLSWHHYAFVVDNLSFSIYLDGVVQMTAAFTGPVVDSHNAIMLGAKRANIDGTNQSTVPDANFVDGILDEVRFENVARDASWIAYQVAAMKDQIIDYGPVEHP
jgi:hypothetical protein